MPTDDNQSATTVYSRYQSYLLRLWQESPSSPWRASLQNATTGERQGFSDLESLFSFLQSQIDREVPTAAYCGDGSV